MLKDRTDLPKSRVRLTVSAETRQFREQFQLELAEVAKTVRITGFRPGKAPLGKVLEQAGRARVEAGVLDRLVSHAYYDAVQAATIVPVGQPSVNVEEYNLPGDSAAEDALALEFTAEVDVLPQADIDGYKKIKLKKSAPEAIKDEDVTTVVEYLRKQKSVLKELEEPGVAKTGMWAKIGYTGTVNGVARPDMHNDHHPIVIGDGQLVPGFEDALIGMKPEERKTFSVTFPTEYHAADLAGKPAEFTVTLHELKEVILPELDRDFAQQFGHDTMERLTDAIRQSLVDERAEEFARGRQEEALEALAKLGSFELPETLIAQERERLFVDARKRMSQMPGQWERYLEQAGKTPDELKEELTPQAEKNVRTGLLLGKLVQEEGIEDSETAGRQALDRLVELASA
jgi:trigger factor